MTWDPTLDRLKMQNHLILLGWFATYYDGTPAIAHPDHGVYFAYGSLGALPGSVMCATRWAGGMEEISWELIPCSHFPALAKFAVEKSKWV